MKESYGEGPASRPGLESCADSCETVREALTEVHVGQVLSREMDGTQSADVVHNSEGKTSESDTRARAGLCEVIDPVHAWKLHAREPGYPANARHDTVHGPAGEGHEP